MTEIFSGVYTSERGDLVMEQFPDPVPRPRPNANLEPLPRPRLTAVWFLQNVQRLVRDVEGSDLRVVAVQFDGDDCLVALSDGTGRRINQELEIVRVRTFAEVRRG